MHGLSYLLTFFAHSKLLSYDKTEKLEGLKICWGVLRQDQLKENVLFLKYLNLEGISPHTPSFSPVMQNLVKHGFTMKGILKDNGSESCVVIPLSKTPKTFVVYFLYASVNFKVQLT